MPPYYVLAYIVKLKDDFQQQGEITAGGGQGTGSKTSPGTDIDGNIWIKDLRLIDANSCKTSAKNFIDKNSNLFKNESKDFEFKIINETSTGTIKKPISGCSILKNNDAVTIGVQAALQCAPSCPPPSPGPRSNAKFPG